MPKLKILVFFSMKAKSLFMFETTYNYHEEDFFNPGRNPVRKEHETFLIH